VSGFVGSCSDYILIREEERAASRAESKPRETANGRAKPDAQTAAGAQTAATPAKPKKRTYKEQKEFEGIEAEITRLEERKAELEALMSGGETDHVRLRELTSEFETVSSALDAKYERWEYLASF